MKFRILILLSSLMMFFCGDDNLTSSDDLGIKVEQSHIQIENGYPACVVTIKKDGRSLSDSEEVRFVVEFFRNNDSVGTANREIGGIPGNGQKTSMLIELSGSRNSNPDRCEVTSITLLP